MKAVDVTPKKRIARETAADATVLMMENVGSAASRAPKERKPPLAPPRPLPFRSILVPVDGSTFAEQAIPIALAIAKRARSKVKLVLVHRQPKEVIPLELGQDYIEARLATQKSETEYVRALAARLREPMGRTVSTAMLKGSVAQALGEYVKEIRPDLVVMTTHGRGALRRAWLGSVADELVRSLPIPIVLLRPGETDSSATSPSFQKILVPLDGSRLAEAVLEPAAAFARLWGAEINLVRIVYPSAMSLGAPLDCCSGDEDQPKDERQEAAQNYLDKVVQWLRQLGVRASGLAVIGSWVAETLLDLTRSDGVGLVAIATHGRGGVRRLVLGSVADKLVRAAEVPVLVYRPTRRSKRGYLIGPY
jgi:nucleotide-binding universal stress UspA family protein